MMTQTAQAFEAAARIARARQNKLNAWSNFTDARLMRFVAECFEAAHETLRPYTPNEHRVGKFEAMRLGSDTSAPNTMIYGIALSDMNDEEIRIAAYME